MSEHAYTKSERELFLKKIYDYCMKVEWKREKIEQLAVELNRSSSKIRYWARLYAKEFLSCGEYQNINDFVKKDQNVGRLRLSKQNPILYKEFQKITYQLWENEKEREVVLKYIYYYCEENHYSNKKIVELLNWLGLNTENRIIEYAKSYAIEYLNYTEEEFYKNKKDHALISVDNDRKKGARNTYDQLLTADSLEDIINIIENSQVSIDTLRSAISNYVVLYKDGDKQIINILKKKIKIYSEYIAAKKKGLLQLEKEQVSKEFFLIAEEVIKNFIYDDENDTIDRFCNKYDIDRNSFDKYVILIKDLDLELFNLYVKKIEITKKQKYSIIIKKINMIIEKLKNGIEEYGVTRPFDLIDYYLIIKISLKDILRISKAFLSNSDFMVLKKFVEKNISGDYNNVNDIKLIMSEIVFVSYEKDNKGNPIPGTEKIFSSEKKKMLINYLKQNNIPINLKTYNVLYKRYKNGFFDLNKVNTKNFSL